jgi:hypothetical protein
MVNLWSSYPHKSINIQESDDYLERKEKPPSSQLVPPWVESILQPLVIGIMVACLSQSIAQLMRQVMPGWRYILFLIAPVLAALAGYATYQTIRKRLISGNESTRYQIYELVLIFVLCKLVTLLDNTIPELLATAQMWFTDPKSFFDGESILMFLLSLIAWLAAAATSRDLINITDPTLYIGEKSPLQRISTRFFAGGFVLLITTAFSRVKFLDLLQSDRPRVPGLILNVLIYFMLGLFMLGQINYMHHTGIWRRQKVNISKNLGLMWLRYSLLFLGVITLIAFFLPTGYTMGLLDLVRNIISILFFIANLIVFLLSYPFLLLISLLFKNAEVTMPTLEAPSAAQPLEVAPTETTGNWIEIVRSLLFWTLALVALGYVIRGYLHDRSNLPTFLRKIKPGEWLVALLHWVSSLWNRLKTTVEETMPRLVNRLRRMANQRTLSTQRQLGPGFRERVFGHYLGTLDVAKEEGLARAKNQTPYEYNKVINPKLPEIVAEWTQLTDIFIEARYSTHIFNKEMADQAASDAQKIQDSLRNINKDPKGFENS